MSASCFMRLGSWKRSSSAARVGAGVLVAWSMLTHPALAQCEPQWLSGAFGSGMAGVDGTSVHAIAVAPNGDIFAAGSFRSAGGTAAHGIARWDGARWHSLGSGTFSLVQCLLALPNGRLVAGGEFTTMDGLDIHNSAMWDGSQWFSMGIPRGGSFFSGLGSPPRALTLLQNGDVVAASGFSGANDQGLDTNVSRWNGSYWTSMRSQMNLPVRALLTLLDGRVVAGGSFTQASFRQANYVALWDGESTWYPMGENRGNTVGFGNNVFALVLSSNGVIVAGGEFTGNGSSTPVRHVARWNGVDWEEIGGGTNGTVYALAVLPNGDIVAGGLFSTAGGTPASNIARWNGSAWSAFGLGVNGTVRALGVASNGDLIVGGDFTVAGDFSAPHIARWSFMNPAVRSEPRSRTVCVGGSASFMVQVSGDQPLVYQWRLNGVSIDPTSNASAATATLTIPDVQIGDAGEYECAVVGPCGSVTSRAAVLTICVADFNCDGFVDFFDYDSFVVAYEVGAPEADVNRDGFLDFFDYDDFVAAFEAGC